MTRRPEQELQRQVIALFGAVLPADVFWAHYPAGGKRSRIEAAIFKGLGVVAGTPDLILIRNGCTYWIELKSAKGSLTMNQVAVHQRLRNAGALVETCRSVDDVIDVLTRWKFPLRGQLAA